MNRTAVITGVSGGIGQATARLFGDAGWTVVGIDKCEMSEQLDRIHFIKGDIAEKEIARKLFNDTSAIIGKLDVLVNNAAIQICKPFMEIEVNEWDAIFNSNLRSMYLAIRNCYPFMRKRGGAIVNVSSVHAIATSTNIAAYAASKGAILALTRALALEMAIDGIRVNAVLPGAVDTQMLRESLTRWYLNEKDLDEKLKELGEKTPLKRIGNPKEIAKSILFLADNDWSSFITGEGLVVDGGALARLSTE